MVVTGSWVAFACFLVVMSKTQVKEVLGDCNDAHSIILASIPASIHAPGVIYSTKLKSFWRTLDPTTMSYLRTVSVQGIMTEDQLSTTFPAATSLLGPACYMQTQIYGRDLSYPMSSTVVATYAQIMIQTYQKHSHLVVTRAWSAKPATPTNHNIRKGLQELMASLPGPPSPSCTASFREDDFNTQHICLEVWWRRNTLVAIIEYLSGRLRQRMMGWTGATMSDLGFRETHPFRSVQHYQPAALRFLKPSHFTPSISFRFTLMMQGICLFPFSTAKQFALETVLVHLMGESNVFVVKLERVTYALPFVTDAANGSTSSYFFVNVTILGGKYEGANFTTLSQLFGADGPFMGKGADPSPLQQALERVALPVSALKATPPQLLHGHPPVTPRDMIQNMMDQQRRWRWRGLLAAGLTGTAILAASIFVAGSTQRRAELREEAPAGTARIRVELCSPPTTISEGISSNDTWPLLGPLSTKVKKREARNDTAEDTAHPEMANPTRGKTRGLTGSRGRGRGTLLDCHTDLLGSSWGSSNANTTSGDQRVVRQSLVAPVGDTVHFDALWDADIIPPQKVVICQKSDGTPWLLGSGSFGQVVKGMLDGVHEVALKISRHGFSKKLIMREMSLLKSCQNSNIVQFLGVCWVRDSVWLVMEYMPGGDLRSFLDLQENWTWGPRAVELALDISRGLAYLHSQRVIHMDIKSGNVLLTSGGQAKVADVGMAHILAESETHGSNLELGTFAYTAPEIILYGKGSWSADIFSFGVILWWEIPMTFCSDGPASLRSDVSAILQQN
eukprot:jgi/Botrbrau1/11578/Bobra.247_1s0001.3